MNPFKVLIFLAICILLLAGISFFVPKEGFRINEEITIKYPSAEKLLKKKEVDTRTLEEIAQFKQDSIQYALKLSDSLSFEDSLSIYESFDKGNPAVLHHPGNDKSQLFALFKYLDGLKEKDTSAHILHYGDSQIEMDRITGYLRERFQERFGGNGPGLLAPKPLTPGYNLSHFFSENWDRKVPFGPKSVRASHYRYGPVFTVCSFDSLENASVSVRARKKSTQGVKKFDVLKIYYKGGVQVSAAGSAGGKVFQSTDYARGLKVAKWQFDTFQNRASFSFSGDSTAEIYALSLESKVGVYMDNVPMRGASGTFFTTVDSAVLGASLRDLNARMIILEFGGNVMPVMNSKRKAIWYGQTMAKQIKRIKELRPEAIILFIGPADMTTTNDGESGTHPYLELVIKELKKNVLEAGAIYWDMYAAMGGKNSMMIWRNNKPSLASSDGIHFTKKGAEKIAKMLFETIENEYKIYEMKKRLEALDDAY